MNKLISIVTGLEGLEEALFQSSVVNRSPQAQTILTIALVAENSLLAFLQGLAVLRHPVAAQPVTQPVAAPVAVASA